MLTKLPAVSTLAVSCQQSPFILCSYNSLEIIVGDDHACLGYGGGEVWVRPFEILAYATKTQ